MKLTQHIQVAHQVHQVQLLKTMKQLQQLQFNTTTTTSGAFVNQDGHVSEDTMRIQDSLYYQDFSYVIKVGRSITEWKIVLKRQCIQQVLFSR